MKLDRKFIDQLIDTPETGTGYHLVDIKTRDGNYIYNIIVSNCEEIQETIIDIEEIIPNKDFKSIE